MPEPTEFSEIDFEQIEYRNEYRHTKSIFASLFGGLCALPGFVNLMTEGGMLAWLGGYGLALQLGVTLFLWVKLKSRLLVTGSGITLRRPLLKEVEIPYSEIGEITFEDGWIGPGKMLTTLNLSEAQPRWEIKSQEEGGKLVTLEL